MNATVLKTNNRKLLVAVMAMALVAVGAVTLFSDDTNAVVDDNDVASIGDTGYDTLDEAIAAATAENNTITLLKDATLSSSGSLTIGVDGLTINGGGHTITVKNTTYFTKNVTFNNVTLKSSNTSETAAVVLAANYNNGVTMTFNEVTFDTGINTIYVYDGNSAVFEGCTFTSGTIAYAHTDAASSPSITLNDTTGKPDMSIQDTVSGSSIIIGEDIVLSGTTLGTITVSDETTLEVPTGETLRADSITGNGSITGDGKIDAEVDDSIAYADREFNNKITLEDGAVINAKSSIVASSTQEIVINGNVTIANGGFFTVNGKLTINEGGSLTVETGGYINVGSTGIVDVQGDLYLEAGSSEQASFKYGGCQMSVSGYVSLQGADSFTTTGTGIIISGTFEVGEDATADMDGAEIAENGELIVNGVVTADSLTNNGTVTIDSQGIDGGDGEDAKVDMTITLGSTGVVDVINVFGTVTINDDGLKYTVDRAEQAVKNNSAVVLTNVAGIYVSEAVDSATGEATMFISGDVSEAVNFDSTDVTDSKIEISAGENSNVEIADSVSLASAVQMNVAGNLTVSGDVTATYDAESNIISVADGGELTVTGKITTSKTIYTNTSGKLNAAYYSASPNHIYTSLQTALSDGATDITLYGDNEVTADITVPVGTRIGMNGATLTIAEDATMTVSADDRNSGKINNAGQKAVIVDGTLVLENQTKSGLKNENVLSDTYKTADKSMTFTNIYKALEDAVADDTVTISRGAPLTIDRDVEVKAGVTLSVPTNESITVSYGATVTVNGTVEVDGGTYTITPAETEDNKDTVNVDESVGGATIVNGMFRDATSTDGYQKQIVGAYFYYDGMDTIAPLASVPAIADDIESDVELYGEMELGDIDFSAYTGEGLTVIAKNDLTFGTMTLGNVELDASGATTVTGTIVLANGTVDLDNVAGIIAQDVAAEDDAVQSTVTGTKVKAYNDSSTENVAETGSVSFTGTIYSSATYTGVEVTVPAGATLNVTGGSFNDLTIDGTVEASANFSGTDVTVTGTLNVAESAEATITTLYAGVSTETVDGVVYVSDSYEAVITGDVTITTAYVGPDATMPENFGAGLKTTEYNVEDAVYVTAYTSESEVAINSIGVDLEYADFEGWLKTDGTKIGISDYIGNPTEVYASLNYNIIEVQISTLPGATIYIDGQEYNGEKITVGDHKIDVYVNPGFTGTPVIQVNGQDVANGGTFNAVAGETVEISVSGITAIDYSQIGSGSSNSDDGLGLTDILLIILVVLIVIMAIMVAMRLMRS